VQLILSKFLSNFKGLVIWESGTTQASDSIWYNLYKSFTQILSVQLIQILSVQLTQILYTNPFGAAYTNPFDATYIFNCLYFQQLIFLVQFDRSCNLYFGAAYSFGGSIQSIMIFDEELRREYSKCVSEINILLIQIVCVLWRDRMKGVCLKSSLCN
jgi:hypothetical protein